MLPPDHICIFNMSHSVRMCLFLGLLAEELKSYGIQDIFVFCTRGELSKYRVPNLLDLYQQYGITTHHHPIPDGGTPDIASCCEIMEELAACLKNNRKTLIQYVRLFSIPYREKKKSLDLTTALFSYFLPPISVRNVERHSAWYREISQRTEMCRNQKIG